MRETRSGWLGGAAIASAFVAGVFFFSLGARDVAARGSQQAIASAGTACFTLLVDEAPTGPRIAATRQVLQKSLGADELVYIQGAEAAALASGSQMQIVRPTAELEHPTRGGRVGTILEVLGTAEVIETSPDLALVRVVASCREVEVGDYLRPLPAEMLPDIPRLPVFDADHLITPSDADAYVVMGSVESVSSDELESGREAATHQEQYAQGDLVSIDQGVSSSWQLADLATIYRDRPLALMRGTAYQPPLILGRGLVVRVDADTAILEIIDSEQEIHLGDRMRRSGSALDYVNNPPTINCNVERSTVRTGESVRVAAVVSDPDSDPTTVRWSASAGTLSASEGLAVTWNSSGVAEGPVSITGTVTDGREGTATCALGVTVASAPTAAAAGPGAAVGVAAGPNVLSFTCPEFPSGSTRIDNRCKAILDDVALRMRQNPQATASMAGHSDSTGDDEVNRTLSQERADNARLYLVETHGLDATRISTSGAGSSSPIADNDTPEGQLRNRRVEIQVTVPGQ